ncbi:Cytochrome P450 3A24 [Exaiptasia diaphana]|nr:Cytochrome P450 3A24 [Exaiptasia diaphana]
MVPAIERSNKTLMSKLQGIADTGKSIDIYSWFSLMTLEVILSTSFGVESPVQTEGICNEFMVKSREVIKQPAVLIYMLMVPLTKLWDRIYLKFESHCKFFAEVGRNILKIRKEEGIRGTKDILDIMLSAKNPNGTLKLTEDEMVGQSIAFLLAGHETSSNALTMSAYFLALNQDIQDRLRSEILTVRQANPDKPLYELVNDLEYLECVLCEVLRMSPPAYVTDRSCNKDYKLNETSTIPAGMAVFIAIHALHHDPSAWPDPEKFDPERFRGSAKLSRHPFQFLPFGEGPRFCIGKRFAILELKITLVDVLTKYKFMRCPETEVPLKMVAGMNLMPEMASLLESNRVLEIQL